MQQRDLAVHFKDNPSLASNVPVAIEQAYGNALIEAASETGLAETTFLAVCPWTLEQSMIPDFWPEPTEGQVKPAA